ncbi:hypothetical protein [Photobacterium damselae]|uniref:Uncharacterized protein n=1 Tax=Photobacterium damselae subsp. damselae TaxID=85581 RepID=A0A850QTV4_PHODD|nr:hypothetical protein [Photobacterium damselae]NVP01334.1 hypothetical protein [Photobacterium damselae subsp. damselae]TLS87011.1 hypothetical protein FD720_09325 [Photobacterium damselae subsp. damselae]
MIVKIEIDGIEYNGTYCVSKDIVYVNYGIADQKKGYTSGNVKATAEMLLRELIREKNQS